MMTEWILILLITISGFVKGVNIDKIPGFQSREACEAAAAEVRARYKSKKLTLLCVPTKIQKDLSNR